MNDEETVVLIAGAIPSVKPTALAMRHWWAESRKPQASRNKASAGRANLERQGR